MDTSPAVSGTNVQPIIHRDYGGGDIVLPGDPAEVIRVEEHPVLRSMIGDDIITSDGTTLLGSDDKSGIAAIMTMADILMRHPELPHGEIAIAFTPDEEVGLGVEHFDVEGFGARYAYTVDGGAIGELNSETWSARAATITFAGKSTHPGTAKNVMVNAIYAVATFVAGLPADMRPETTEEREGFLHPCGGSLDVAVSTLKVLLRDFDLSGLEAQERILRELAAATETAHPGVHVSVEVTDSYRNMHEIVRQHPALIEHAFEATRRVGLQPYVKPIRGGTDGSKLTFKGIPCPNIFTGGHNFHSKQEFNSRRGLETTTDMLVQLVQVFAERS
jgi:tripeptide aminopeptidase